MVGTDCARPTMLRMASSVGESWLLEREGSAPFCCARRPRTPAMSPEPMARWPESTALTPTRNSSNPASLVKNPAAVVCSAALSCCSSSRSARRITGTAGESWARALATWMPETGSAFRSQKTRSTGPLRTIARPVSERLVEKTSALSGGPDSKLPNAATNSGWRSITRAVIGLVSGPTPALPATCCAGTTTTFRTVLAGRRDRNGIVVLDLRHGRFRFGTRFRPLYETAPAAAATRDRDFPVDFSYAAFASVSVTAGTSFENRRGADPAITVARNTEYTKVALGTREIPSLKAIAAEKSGRSHGTDRVPDFSDSNLADGERMFRLSRSKRVEQSLFELSGTFVSLAGGGVHGTLTAMDRAFRTGA